MSNLHTFLLFLLISFSKAVSDSETCADQNSVSLDSSEKKECELRKAQILDNEVIGCLSLEQKPRIIYDVDTWKFLQDEYERQFNSQTNKHEYGYVQEWEFKLKVDHENEESIDASDDASESDDARESDNSTNSGITDSSLDGKEMPFISIVVPHEVRYLPNGGGRGVFVTEDIELDEIVYDASAYGIFRTEAAWKSYVLSVASHSVELACDILQWAYVQTLDDGTSGVCVDLSVGSLLNHGGEEANVYEDHDMQLADRDIKAGEQIFDNYLLYMRFDEALWFANMVKKAWADDCNPNQDLFSKHSNEQRWSYRPIQI